MSTRAELIARIKSDIADITTPRGIKKPKVASILTDLVNLATPAVESGGDVQIYEIDGRPVYKRLIFVPDGSNLENVDLTIPENHSLVALTSAAAMEFVSNAHFTSVLSLGNKFLFFISSSQQDPFEIRDYDVNVKFTFADLSEEFATFTSNVEEYTILKSLEVNEEFDIEILPTSKFYLDPEKTQEILLPGFNNYKQSVIYGDSGRTSIDHYIYTGKYSTSFGVFSNLHQIPFNVPFLKDIYITIEYIGPTP